MVSAGSAPARTCERLPETALPREHILYLGMYVLHTCLRPSVQTHRRAGMYIHRLTSRWTRSAMRAGSEIAVSRRQCNSRLSHVGSSSHRCRLAPDSRALIYLSTYAHRYARPRAATPGRYLEQSARLLPTSGTGEATYVCTYACTLHIFELSVVGGGGVAASSAGKARTPPSRSRYRCVCALQNVRI